MPQCVNKWLDRIIIIIFFFYYWRPTNFFFFFFCSWLNDFFGFLFLLVTSKRRRGTLCVVEVRIFIGTIHLRDDEEYQGKVLECSEHRVVLVHLPITHSRNNGARRILALGPPMFCLSFHFIFCFVLLFFSIFFPIEKEKKKMKIKIKEEQNKRQPKMYVFRRLCSNARKFQRYHILEIIFSKNAYRV